MRSTTKSLVIYHIIHQDSNMDTGLPELTRLRGEVDTLRRQVKELRESDEKRKPRLFEASKELNVRPMFMIISYAFGTALPMEDVARINNKPFVILGVVLIYMACGYVQDYAAERYARIADNEGRNPPRAGWYAVLNIYAYLIAYSFVWFGGMLVQSEAHYWHMDGPFPATPIVNSALYLLAITAIVVATGETDGIPARFASEEVRRRHEARRSTVGVEGREGVVDDDDD